MSANRKPASDGGGLKGIFRALRHRNYRLFFGGQSISLIGTWLTRVATSWLVYRLTDSAAMLGLVSFASLIPTFLLAPLAGVLVDRWNRHRLLMVTQVLAMIQSFLLAGLALSHIITVWHIVALSVFQGLVNAFDMPSRQAFVVEMVEGPEDLPNAIALNSSMFNGARLLGPSIGGVLIATVGEGICFLLDGISYLAVIASLLAMKVAAKKAETRDRHVMRELADGFKLALGSGPIRDILLLVALVGLMGMPFAVVMPVFARDILHGGAHAFGFLMAASGLGALLGALVLASRKTVLGLGRIISLAAGLFGCSLILFAVSRLFWLSMPLIFLAGFGMMVQTASCNTIIQTIVDDDKRGRVMSFYAVAFLGMSPFGSLLTGSLASKLGAPTAVALDGAVCLLGALFFARRLPGLRRQIRPIYVRKGIIPETIAPR